MRTFAVIFAIAAAIALMTTPAIADTGLTQCFDACRASAPFKAVCASYLDAASGKRMSRIFFNKCVFICNKNGYPTSKFKLEGNKKTSKACKKQWQQDTQISQTCFYWNCKK